MSLGNLILSSDDTRKLRVAFSRYTCMNLENLILVCPATWECLHATLCRVPVRHTHTYYGSWEFCIGFSGYTNMSRKYRIFPSSYACACFLKVRCCVLLTHKYTFLKICVALTRHLNMAVENSVLCSVEYDYICRKLGVAFSWRTNTTLGIKFKFYDTRLCRLGVMFSWQTKLSFGNYASCSCNTRLHLLETKWCVLLTHNYVFHRKS
jgi:hypothetical protein